MVQRVNTSIKLCRKQRKKKKEDCQRRGGDRGEEAAVVVVVVVEWHGLGMAWRWWQRRWGSGGVCAGACSGVA